MKAEFKNILDVVKHFPDEITCRNFLAESRWGKTPVCVHCGSFRKIYKVQGGKLLKCADCRKQFSVRIGTIFEDSALPLQTWFMAIYLLTAHKKGISSVQLGRDIGVTQKTAWFMLHRIRHAVRTKSFEKPLTGTIEADETYIGGEEKNKHANKRTKNNHGRSLKTKTAVFGIRQRGGIVVAQKVDSVSRNTLDGILKSRVHPDSTIMTDEMNSYTDLSVDFLHHHTINHQRKEYVRGRVHTNSIESFWALLKRGIYGIYHQVSPKHLDKYVDEFEFRFNSKHIADTERFRLMLNHIDGRLMYKDLTKNS
ncbi:MAG: IS1595 family transposase [Bacteroidota bacterium]